MKVALICCAKQEENYINEWLEHNYIIGIDHIYLCDNNDSDYNINISSVINDKYKNFVTVLDYHNQVNVQNRCYKNVYKDIKTLYDWICIFDCDEFLHLDTFNNISEYINFIDKDNDIDEIVIPWKLMYSDDSLTSLYYNNAPLKKRFDKELEYIDNSHTQSKVIFKSTNNVDNVRTHYIATKEGYNKKSVNSIGEIINYNNNSGIDVNYNINIYLKHYNKKSFEEYLTNKIFRTRAQAGVENYYYIRQPKQTNILNFLINSYGVKDIRFNYKSIKIDNIYLKLYDEYFDKYLPFIKTNYYNDDKADITLNHINIDNFNDNEFINIILYNYIENFRNYIRIYLSKNIVRFTNLEKRIDIILSDKTYNINIKENKFLYLNNDCYELKYNDNQLSIISNKKIL